MVMICRGNLNVSEKLKEAWEKRDDGEIIQWKVLFERARRHYGHYRAILEGNIGHPDFARKQAELAQTRKVLGTTSYRGTTARKEGLGPQDVNHEKEE